MKQSKSISDSSEDLGKADIPAWYMVEVDVSFKRSHGINENEKWHGFFVDTDSTPINQWDNLSQYTYLYNT